MRTKQVVQDLETRKALRQVVVAFLRWDENVYAAEFREQDQQDVLWGDLQRAVVEASRLLPARLLPQGALRRCGM